MNNVDSIGFIGLGGMGSAIAHNLLTKIKTSNFSVYNRTESKSLDFVAAHPSFKINIFKSAEELAKQARADIIFIVLMDDASVLQLFSDNFINNSNPNTVFVNLTTVSPNCSEIVSNRIKNKNNNNLNNRIYLAGPVLGRPIVARSGQLRSFLSGSTNNHINKNIRNKIKEIITNSYSSSGIIDCGDNVKHASVMKLMANFTLISNINLFAQIFSVTEKYDIDVNLVRQILEMLYPFPALKHYVNAVADQECDGSGGFSLSGGLKDCKLILETGESVMVPLPHATHGYEQLLAALSNGHKNKDWVSMISQQRKASGLAFKPDEKDHNTIQSRL